MATDRAPNELQRPGDYTLREIVLVNSIGEKFDIRPFVLELNIYENIYQHTMKLITACKNVEHGPSQIRK